MKKLKVFCFGFGQVAENFINKLIIEKKDFDLSITSRQETHQIEFNNLKITSFFFNNDKIVFGKSFLPPTSTAAGTNNHKSVTNANAVPRKSGDICGSELRIANDNN